LYKSLGIEWKIIPTIEISPTKGQRGSACGIIQQLRTHSLDNQINQKLRRYPHMKVNDVHEFCYNSLPRNTKDARMDWILSLDVSVSAPMNSYNSLPYALLDILPNLREINLFNTYGTLRNFSFRCPLLEQEKVTCNNINTNLCIKLNGDDMSSFMIKNLKEIIMDDSRFDCSHQYIAIMSD
jgi:hypothetical protein